MRCRRSIGSLMVASPRNLISSWWLSFISRLSLAVAEAWTRILSTVFVSVDLLRMHSIGMRLYMTVEVRLEGRLSLLSFLESVLLFHQCFIYIFIHVFDVLNKCFPLRDVQSCALCVVAVVHLFPTVNIPFVIEDVYEKQVVPLPDSNFDSLSKT